MRISALGCRAIRHTSNSYQAQNSGLGELLPARMCAPRRRAASALAGTPHSATAPKAAASSRAKRASSVRGGGVAGGHLHCTCCNRKFNEISARASGMEADEKNILAMPMRKDDSRPWTYRVPDQYFAREFVLQLAGLQDYVHRHGKHRENIPPMPTYTVRMGETLSIMTSRARSL
jgi:hypothetical protein